ncbi:hypothetical protein ID866_7900 [Astraeus odoratus]|nr:hypothetical protein ID866_7900 [Astraeus odoratus]
MSTHLDLGYFHNHRLRTENGLQDALAYLTTVLAADDVCIEQLVYDLLSVPNRFAYICTDAVFAEFPAMRNRITNAFPTNPADLPQSFAKYLLIELSTLFFALPPHAFDEHGLRIVGQYKRYVMDVWPALSVLLDTDFDAINAAIELQKSFKRKTLVSKIPKFNEVPLNNLGVSIPLNADEAKKVATGILSTLKNILHFYFNLLSKDDLADFVRDAYFNNNLHPLSLQTHRSPESHTDVDQSSSTSAIYPQLLKAALQVDGVEGFGQWNIVISSSATKDLKEIKWSDKRRAEFVMNKIFQLSKGRFSGNNQKRLNCPSHGIPVYQAEVLSNLRIVMHSPFLAPPGLPEWFVGLIADEEVQLPFQLTAEEWDVVQSRTSCFVIGRSGTGKTTTVLYKMLGIHRAWQETSGCLKPRQMFVTKSRVLRAKVEESFNNLLESLALGRTREELKLRRAQGIRGQEPALIDPMNTLDCRPGTPRRFSELTDDDFPLFITFDHLARLVAADLPHDVSLTCLDDKYSFVKYEDFVNRYWPRLPQRDTKGLGRLCDTATVSLDANITIAPWLVFSEFMGVIKGSEKALHQPSGCLDKQTYMEMSARAYPNFAYQRETLYKVFEAYCSLKLQECGYDMADRTHSILKLLLSGASLKGRRVDYMYVDEVQDILITDALLLRILCRNPEGLLWAGDTAQTISAGSSFRFQDLKAFMYRTELTANYRSHSGIVNCAQAVVGLIGRFWPNSIDSLRPEQGRTHGLKPIFFSDWEEGIFSPEQFFSGMKEKQIELGAEQCILVRNSAARHRLKEQVGDDALILTLQESKGLEFNDIFLYNFFEDSSAGHSQWSLVLSDCTDCPTFRRDNSQNALLCTELKVLYVGITRARNNLYFLDKSEQGKLMRTFWSSHDLIRRAPAGANIFNYVVSSNPDEWAASGRKLFAASQFNEAARCFRRAGEPHQREFRIAEAFHLREDAKRIFPLSAARSTFLEAGKAFTSCAEETLNFESRMEYYNNAGDCYAQGNDVSGAGASYILAENFVAATRVYYNTERFEDIIQMFERHHVKIRPDYDSILFSVCRRHYYSENVRSPIPLFLSLEEELDYVKKEGFNDAWARLLESCGRNLEAAQVHLCRGQVVKAVQSCLKAQQDEATFQFAVDIALDSLWPRCSFIAIPAKKSFQKTVSDVLEIASNFPSERLSTSECDQLRFFEALCQPSQNEIYQLGCQFLRRGDDFLALAALDRAFSQFPVLNSANLDEMDDYLEQFGTYIHLLISVISDGDPLANRGARRVFGVIELPDHYYGVTKENLDDHFVIESIVKGLDGAEDDCISHGVSALQHMVRKGVRLDLSTIYDYLEEMCSTLVISSHLHPGGCSSIHDLVVPRKWLANPNKLSGNKDTSSTPAFFAAVRELLDRLRSGKAPKWFALPRNSESFIDITMAKLCRLLCIVGYNSCDAATSERIANILLFSQRVETVESDPHVIRRSEYLSAVRSFDKDTNSEDLVQLIHKENSHTTRPVSPHITFVVYDDVVDIPRIVCRSPDASALLAVQGPYIELTGAELTEDIDDCKWSYPTEEVTAACQIQMAYRLHRIRCASPIPRLPWEAAADKFFMLCLEEVVFSGRKADRYRRVYLNKLPTLLACLEQGLKITYAVRKEASEHLSKESGKKWKDAVDQSTILINEGELLRKILDPQAPLHDRPNIQAFRAAARRISNFIRGIAIGGEGWDKSLQDAVDSVIADL